MGLLSSLFGFGRRNVQVRYVSAATHVLGYSTAELYITQPALRAVVSFISGNVASIPIKCYVRESDTSRRRDTKGVAPVLLANPNDHTTTHELMVKTVSDLKLYGFAAWVVVPSLDGPSGWTIEEIPSAWVSDITSRDGITATSYRIVNPVTKKETDIDASDVILFSDYSPEGIGNASPVNALKQVLAEQVSAWEYRNQVWKNGGRVSQVIERPLGAEWSPEERERFAKSWKNRFAGNEGTDSGGTPLLEDGMKLVQTQFNAREAQWQEATRLAREDVAAVYHINPSLVWHTDSQTYASAKDSARALYAETLQPILDMLSERINAFLLPKIGAPANEYVEFDISKKLEASFEEQASVLQSSTGAPWMTRNEARARLNLPEIEGADELIVPMNVSEGGLASPNDTDPGVQRYSGHALAKEQRPSSPVLPHRPLGHKARGSLASSTSDELEASLGAFYEMWGEDVADLLVELGDFPTEGWMEWWNKDEWVELLTDEMVGGTSDAALEAAYDIMALMGSDPEEDLDVEALFSQLRDESKKTADDIVQSTYTRLADNLHELGSYGEEDVRACVAETFDSSFSAYGHRNADHIARSSINQATVFGAKQADPNCQKEWHTNSGRPRATHLAASGQKVPIDGWFSVGSYSPYWPHDTRLPASEAANCSCTVDIISKGKNLTRERRIRGVVDDMGLEGYNPEKVDDAIRRCQYTIGCDGRPWDELTPQEQANVLKELHRRDREWVANGIVPEVDYSESPLSDYGRLAKGGRYNRENIGKRGKEWRDIVVHDTLANNGFVETTRSTKGVPKNYKHIDLFINGELWEVKSPDNTQPTDPLPKDPLGFIGENLKKANSQFRHQYDPDTKGTLDYRENKRVVLNMTYRDVEINDEFIARLRQEADEENIDEVLLITRGDDWGLGYIVRIK